MSAPENIPCLDGKSELCGHDRAILEPVYGYVRQSFASELGPRPFQRLQLAVASRLMRDGSEKGYPHTTDFRRPVVPGEHITPLAIFMPVLMTLAWVGSICRLLRLGGCVQANGTRGGERRKHRRAERDHGSKGILRHGRLNGLLKELQFAQATARSAQVKVDAK